MTSHHPPEDSASSPSAPAAGTQADQQGDLSVSQSEPDQEANAEPRGREPIFNIPMVLSAYIAIMVIIELLRSYVISAEWDQSVMMLMAFLPVRYVTPLADQDLAGWLVGPVGYSLLHGGFVHLIFNCLWLAVFATPLVQRIGALRFTALWVTSAAFSAFFHAALTGWQPIFLIGASGVVSATVGAACRFSMQLSGTSAMRYARYAPRLGILEALTKRPVVMFIIMWAVSNVLVVGGAGVPGGGYNIAWQAHVGGFLFGYLTFALFDRDPYTGAR